MSGNGLRHRIVMLLLLCVTSSSAAMAQNLKVRLEADRLRISGPQIHFLTGGPVDRLHNGVIVTYALQLTIRSEKSGHVLSRVTQRFSFSYDLWEEKFTVTRLDSPTRSASNLSVARAEAWCLDNLSLPVTELPRDRSFWVALEFETEEAKDPNKADGSALLTLSSLIDIFSRRARDDKQVRGADEVGPVSLNELRKK